MSTILKALQRLEDEKSAGQDRSLSEQVVARRTASKSKSRWAVMGIALLGGVAVGSSALFFWRALSEPAVDTLSEETPQQLASGAGESAPEQRAADSATSALGTAAADPAQEQVAANSGSTAPVSPMVEVIQRLEQKPAAESAVAESSAIEPDLRGANRPADRRQAARKRALERADTKPSERANPRPAAVAAKRIPEPPEVAVPVVVAAADPTEAAPRTDDPPSEPSSSASEAQSVEQRVAVSDAPPIEPSAARSEPPLGAATPSEPISAAAPPSAPPTRDRKVVRRAEIPLISVDKTVWHPDASRRRAIVELTESGEALQLKEGDALGPLVIETIRPAGVLFVHDGVEVEYRVGQ